MSYKNKIKIKFQNGLTLRQFKSEVFDVNKVSELYEFEETNNPDFVIFGPYGNEIPPKGNYIRIGYFCENFTPDLNICEWAFGIPLEKNVNNEKYFKIQWHGFNPQQLIKPENFNAEFLLESKKEFCNYIYGHPVQYREYFFSQLSKYKKIDSPGKSLNNMPSFDSKFTGGIWERKRKFQQQYKFTLALENYVFPGYQTEKLYDSMLSNSIPIYIGDPNVSEVFDIESFIHINPTNNYWINKIEEFAQQTFIDILPSFYNSPLDKIRRKSKMLMRDYKMNLYMKKYLDDFIEHIIEIDKDDEKYINMLSKPWLNNNFINENTYSTKQWVKIFNS